MFLNCPATNAQIESACMSYRHDFGLLDAKERELVKSTAAYWLEAWMKEGLAFGPDGDTLEILELRNEVKALRERLSSIGNPDQSNTDLRTKVILLQSENAALKSQLEQVTDPVYLTKKLEELGVVDKEYEVIAQRETEKVAVLNSALNKAMQGINDWMHIYAHDLCDEEEVAAARKRISDASTLGYMSNINEAVDKAIKVAEYDGVTLPVDEVLAKIDVTCDLPVQAYMCKDGEGKTYLSTNKRMWSSEDMSEYEIEMYELIDKERATIVFKSLKYEIMHMYHKMLEYVQREHEFATERAKSGKAEDAIRLKVIFGVLNSVQMIWCEHNQNGFNEYAGVPSIVLNSETISKIQKLLLKSEDQEAAENGDLKKIDFGYLALMMLREILAKKEI